MMKPEFATFIHRLCVHFERKDPVPERMDTLFKAVASMSVDQQRLEDMHGWLVSTFDELPRNLSKAMWDAHAATRFSTSLSGQAAGKEGTTANTNWTPPTAEQAAYRQRMCREIQEALRTGCRPPWAGEPRGECCSPDTDSYHRNGRR